MSNGACFLAALVVLGVLFVSVAYVAGVQIDAVSIGGGYK